MNTCPHCNPNPQPTAPPRPPTLLHRLWRTTQFLLPTTLLILMPKCPMCLAAYIALFTGLSIPLTTAHHLQLLTTGVCLTSLTYLTLKLLRRYLRKTPKPTASTPWG